MQKLQTALIAAALFIGSSLLMSGCSGLPQKAEVKSALVDAAPNDLLDKITEADADLEEGKLLDGEETTAVGEHPRVLLKVNTRVKKWMLYFTGRGRSTFTRYMERGIPYKALIESELRRNGVPEEFYYLALIESGFVHHVVSRQKAVGTWQFVRGTGKRYGLRCDNEIDERRDPLRSTTAAARYLKDLYNVFGSWRLALAAYNAGEFRIINAVMKGKSRDFWELAENRQLPVETMNYVPKFLAAAIIGKDPKKYGFDFSEFSTSHELEIVDVPSPISLASLAEKVGMGPTDLKEINPHLVAGFTPRSVKTYGVWVPKDKADQVRSLQVELASLVVPASKLPKLAASHGKTKTYRVKRGDTLAHISKKFGISVSHLKRINKLASSFVRNGQVLKLHPTL